AEATGTQVRIRALNGSVFRSLVLEDVAVAVDGRTILTVPRVALAYHVLPLLRGELRVSSVVLDAPRIRLVRTAHGWVLPTPPGGGGGSSLRVVLDEIRVRDGRIATALLDASPARRLAATAIALDASARIADDERSLDLASLAFVPRGVALSPVHATA